MENLSLASKNEQVKIYCEQVYIPEGFPKIWIEHGHQYDPCNRFYVKEEPFWSVTSPPIFEDNQFKKRLLECVGTRFLLKFINKLDSLYPFVDNVKPFSRFLLVFTESVLEPGYGPAKVGIAVWAMLKYLGKILHNTPSDLLGPGDTGIPNPSSLLVNMIKQLLPSNRESFFRNLREKGFPINIPYREFLNNSKLAEKFAEFLSINFELIPEFNEDTSFLSSTGTGTLLIWNHNKIDETHMLISAAKSMIEKYSLGTVIMGHTHEMKDHPKGLNYINTGCWTRFYNFDKGKMHSWSFLKSYSYETFPYQLNYAEITPQHPDSACLRNFSERRK